MGLPEQVAAKPNQWRTLAMVRAVLVGMLRQYVDGKDAVTLESGAGRSVREVIESLNIPPALVGAVLVGGQLVDKDYRLQDGQEVKLIALIGGG
jgi:sulfur carrier protein ThiS